MMKRFPVVISCLVAVSVTLSAQWVYLAYEQIAVAGTSIGITATVLQPNGANTAPQANVAACRVGTAEIRWRVDGTAPTSTVGTVASPGDVIQLRGADVLQKFRAIRTTSTSAALDCNVAQ